MILPSVTGSPMFHYALALSALVVTILATGTGVYYLFRAYSSGQTPERLYTWFSPLLIVTTLGGVYREQLSLGSLFGLLFAAGCAAGLLSILTISGEISLNIYSLVYTALGMLTTLIVVNHWPYDFIYVILLLGATTLALLGSAIIRTLKAANPLAHLGKTIVAGLGALEMIDFILAPFGLKFVWQSVPALIPATLITLALVCVIFFPAFAVSAFTVATISFSMCFELWSWFEYANFHVEVFAPTWTTTLSLFAFSLGFTLFNWPARLLKR